MKVQINQAYQGPKLTFLGRRQLATEFFFKVAIWKNVVAKKCRKNLRTDRSFETLWWIYNNRKIGFILQKQQKGKK